MTVRCSGCNTLFKNLGLLLGHIGNRCRCRECCKIVCQFGDMRRHLKMHFGIAAAACDRCAGRAFIQYSNYEKHCVKLHPGQPLQPPEEDDFQMPEVYYRQFVFDKEDNETGDETTPPASKAESTESSD